MGPPVKETDLPLIAKTKLSCRDPGHLATTLISYLPRRIGSLWKIGVRKVTGEQVRVFLLLTSQKQTYLPQDTSCLDVLATGSFFHIKFMAIMH